MQPRRSRERPALGRHDVEGCPLPGCEVTIDIVAGFGLTPAAGPHERSWLNSPSDRFGIRRNAFGRSKPFDAVETSRTYASRPDTSFGSEGHRAATAALIVG
jgi:hypothetical protein